MTTLQLRCWGYAEVERGEEGRGTGAAKRGGASKDDEREKAITEVRIYSTLNLTLNILSLASISVERLLKFRFWCPFALFGTCR